jgi:hypothetical protein
MGRACLTHLSMGNAGEGRGVPQNRQFLHRMMDTTKLSGRPVGLGTGGRGEQFLDFSVSPTTDR